MEGTEDNNEEKIYGHEEMMVPNDFLPKFPKLIGEVESESGVRVEVGREMEDDPGRVPLGVVGTALQNVKAWEIIHDAFENYKMKNDDNIRIGLENWSKLQVSKSKQSSTTHSVKYFSAQCVNFIIFLSLRFYVKSILEILARSSKSVILTDLEALDFDFYEYLHFWKAEIYLISKIQSPKNGKIGRFITSKFSEVDFT